MSLQAMQAKIKIAQSLQEQSARIWSFRVKHYQDLSVEDRLKLKEARRTLDARADEVLEDALEEGTEQAEELIAKLEEQTASLKKHTSSIDNVRDILSTAATVSKAAAGIVSGGIPSALSLLA